MNAHYLCKDAAPLVPSNVVALGMIRHQGTLPVETFVEANGDF